MSASVFAASVFPAPPESPESAAFYDAAKAGRLMIPRCTACGRAHWYPRAQCPFCFGPVQWEQASGEGTVYSYSVMRRAKPITTIAYVTLAEGPTMMTSLVDADPDSLHIGQHVRLVFKPSANDGPPIPCFTPTPT